MGLGVIGDATGFAASGDSAHPSQNLSFSRAFILFARNSMVLKMLWRSAFVGTAGDGIVDDIVEADDDDDTLARIT